MKKLKINKKYKVKLRYKHPPIYLYFLFPLIGVLTTLFLFLLENLILIIDDNISFPISLYLYGILITIIFVIFSIYKSPASFSRSQRIKLKLRKVIEENNFFYENHKRRIVSSMTIVFYWIEDNLVLEVYPHGAKYSLKMNDLTLIFQTALNMTVISIQNDYANHTNYILSNVSNNVIDVSNIW